VQAEMIAWLSAYGAPRAAEVLGRLPRHAWAIEPPDSDAATHTEQPTNVRLSNEAFSLTRDPRRGQPPRRDSRMDHPQRGLAPHATGWQDIILTTRPRSNPGRHRGYAGARNVPQVIAEEARHGSS